MDLDKLFSKYILEQPIPDDDLDNQEPDLDDNQADDGETPGDDENHIDQERPTDDLSVQLPNDPKPKREKPLNPIQLLKKKWSEENPYINEEVMNSMINLFNQRKNGFRPYKEEGTEEGYTNLPEIVALKYRYPNFPVDNIQKIKDITQYKWEELEFLMDRVGTRLQNEDTNDYSFLDTKEQIDSFKLKYFRDALNQWNKKEGRIIDEPTIRVFRVESRNESIALGLLQHIYKDKLFGNEGSYWCITNGQFNRGANLYDSYRSQGRSNYFVMNKANRTKNPNYFISCIQPIKTKPGRYNLVRTQNNGDNFVTWDEIVRVHPQLAGKENLFQYFGQTKKEQIDFSFNSVTFNNNPNDPNDFLTLTVNQREDFIRTDRLIRHLYAFKILQDNEIRSYIAQTKLGDFKTRFLSINPSKPFEIIDYLKNSRKKDLFNYLTTRLKEIGIPNGIRSIKNAMILPEFDVKMIEKNNTSIQLLVNKTMKNVGVYDRSIQDFTIEPIFIEKGKMTFYRTQFSEKYQTNIRYNFIITKYTISDNFINDFEDHTEMTNFYTVYPTVNFEKTGDYKKMGSIVLNQEKGDAMWEGAKRATRGV